MLRMLSLLILLASMLVLQNRDAGAIAPALADDWDATAPTGWYWYYGQSPEDISAKIDALGLRIVDLEVQQVSPLRFAAAFVANNGAYQRGWWWYYGLDEAGVNDYLDQNNARLLDVEAYDAGGELRFAVVMVSNTGDDAKAWWWYFGMTPQEILGQAELNDARAIDVERYEIGGQTRYAAVYIHNTGADQRGWWVYVNQSAAEVAQKVDQNGARLIDIWHQPDGELGVVMQACPCPLWWWYTGLTEAQLNQVVNQNGARIIDLDTYVVDNQRLFDAALINTSDPITSRVGELLRPHIVQPNGLYGDAAAGLYVKQVGGSMLAGLYHTRSFEPASTIKVLPHLYAIRRVAGGFAALDDDVVRYNYAPNSCPGVNTNGTEDLSMALTEMMQDSDNARTRAVVDTFGRLDINALASSIGLSNTAINHTMGCGVDAIANPNSLSLADAGTLYEGVADGSLLDGAHHQAFYAAMAGKDYDFSGAWEQLAQIVDQEAPPAMTAAQKQAFRDRIRLAYKAGGYTLCLGGGCSPRQEYRSIAGSATIPFCSNAGLLVPKHYVFGVFVDKAGDASAADTAFNATKAELLREQVASALATWSTCAFQQQLPMMQR